MWQSPSGQGHGVGERPLPVDASLLVIEGDRAPQLVGRPVRAQDDGTFDIVERNCAIATVAVAHPGACRSELEFIRAVLPEADVDRIAHMVTGAPECGYRVSAR